MSYSAAVAVLAVIRSKTNSFPASTIVIEQYRPPIGKFIIGTVDFLPICLTHSYMARMTELPAGRL